MMRKVWFVISILIFIVNVYFTIGWADQPIGPRIFFEKQEFDAKQVDEGEVIEHTFKVLNTGDRPLEIFKVKPG